ncbi:MAG: hypothetical protein ACHQ9S_18960 [Candidatus Binatia bacterium]
MRKFRLIKKYSGEDEVWNFCVQTKANWHSGWEYVSNTTTRDEKQAQRTYMVMVANRGDTVVIATQP